MNFFQIFLPSKNRSMNLPKGVKLLPNKFRPATEDEMTNPRNNTFATFWPDGSLKKVKVYDWNGDSDPYTILSLKCNKREGTYWDSIRSYTDYSGWYATSNIDFGDESCRTKKLMSFRRFINEGMSMFRDIILLVLPPGRDIKL